MEKWSHRVCRGILFLIFIVVDFKVEDKVRSRPLSINLSFPMKNMFIIFFYWYWTIHQWIVQKTMYLLCAIHGDVIYFCGIRILFIHWRNQDTRHSIFLGLFPYWTKIPQTKDNYNKHGKQVLCLSMVLYYLMLYGIKPHIDWVFGLYCIRIFVPKGKNNWIIFIPWNKSYGIFIPPVWHLFHLWEVHLL